MRLYLFLTALFAASIASAEVPRVSVDIAPVHSLVAQVMEGAGEPDLILRPGASPHHYAMRPSEAAVLAEADLVIRMGDALTPWLGSAMDRLAGGARQVVLLEAEQTEVMPLREGVEFEHGAHGEEHDHAHHGDTDPHAWLDPANAQRWLFLIADELSALDSENAELYRANAARRADQLEVLKEEIARRMKPVKNAPFLVFHDAYQYFEAAFGIRAAAAISLGDAARPGPARIAALRDLASQKASPVS